MSFPRRRESSLSKVFWTPAFAGVTAWRTSYETIKFPVRSNWPPRRSAARLSPDFFPHDSSSPPPLQYSITPSLHFRDLVLLFLYCALSPPLQYSITPFPRSCALVSVLWLVSTTLSLVPLPSCMKLHKIDGLAKSRKTPFSVIPAEAGIQPF